MIKVNQPDEDIPDIVPNCTILYQGKKVAFIPMIAKIKTTNFCLLKISYLLFHFLRFTYLSSKELQKETIDFLQFI